MIGEFKNITPEMLLTSALGDFQSFYGEIAKIFDHKAHFKLSKKQKNAPFSRQSIFNIFFKEINDFIC